MLDIKNLSMVYETERGPIKAVNNISFSLVNGEILGLVGESGCGKSATLLSILGLVPYPGKIQSGKILFQGEDLTKKTSSEMRRIRGKDISMIFQDPMTTLNPVFKVGEQVRESLRIHDLIKATGGSWWSRRQQKKGNEIERVLELMREVGIPAPENRYFEYPFQFSGGMQQRAIIAIALSGSTKLLLADEPTTALDVTIQAQILELLRKINRVHGTSIIMVTHDLGMAAEFCQRIAVMYAGEIVEQGHTDQVLDNPKHPYTQGLLRSIPRIGATRRKLLPIPGSVPDLADLDETCPFHPRCDQVNEKCSLGTHTLREVAEEHFVKCALYC